MKLIISLVTLVVLSGCANIRLNSDDSSKISKIKIDENVEMPANPLVGPSLRLNQYHSTEKNLDSNAQFKTLLEAQGVNFEKALLDRSKLTIEHINSKLQPRAQKKTADLHLKVKTYGVVKGWGYTTKPYITIRAELIIDSQKIWSKEFDAHGFSDTLSVPMENTLVAPNLQRLFNSGIDLIMKDIEAELDNNLRAK